MPSTPIWDTFIKLYEDGYIKVIKREEEKLQSCSILAAGNEIIEHQQTSS
jgi:hypothetical protein